MNSKAHPFFTLTNSSENILIFINKKRIPTHEHPVFFKLKCVVLGARIEECMCVSEHIEKKENGGGGQSLCVLKYPAFDDTTKNFQHRHKWLDAMTNGELSLVTDFLIQILPEKEKPSFTTMRPSRFA